MVLNYINTKKHLVDMDFYSWSNSSLHKKSVKSIFFLAVIISFSLWLYLAITNRYFAGNLFYLLIFVGGSLIEAFILVLVFRFVRKIYYSKRLSESNKDTFDIETTLSLEENEIILKTNRSQSKIKYSLINKVSETNKYVFIFIDSADGIPIPLTAFLNEKEKTSFLNYLNNKIASNLP